MCRHVGCPSLQTKHLTRGLCHACYRDLNIRRLYPPLSSNPVKSEESMEELEQIIAARRPTMPKSSARLRQYVVPPNQDLRK